MILATLETNWTDEMDIVGQKIFSNEEWERFKTDVKEIDDSIEICIGTNESIEFNDGQDFLDSIREDVFFDHEISSDILDYLNLDQFGLFEHVEEMIAEIHEEENAE